MKLLTCTGIIMLITFSQFSRNVLSYPLFLSRKRNTILKYKSINQRRYMRAENSLLMDRKFFIKYLVGMIIPFNFAEFFLKNEKVSAADDLLRWDFERGDVELKENNIWIGKFKLSKPKLLGFGGGGSVFYVQILEYEDGQTKINHSETEAILKISWRSSKSEIQNECEILQVLSKSSVPNVEKCLERASYSDDREAILLSPYFDGNLVGSIDELQTEESKKLAIKSLVQTMVRMLAAGVVTADLQPLIRSDSGKTLLIDFSEAATLAPDPDFIDLARVQNFCAETSAFIPSEFYDYAFQELKEELRAVNFQKNMPQQKVFEVMIESLPFGIVSEEES